MSLYDETTEKEPLIIEQPEGKLYEALHNQLGTLLDYEDSIIFINSEINELTLSDLIIRMRSLLQHRKDKDAPVNLMINSPGGDVHEMFGIIDYIESLDVKVNIICYVRVTNIL